MRPVQHGYHGFVLLPIIVNKIVCRSRSERELNAKASDLFEKQEDAISPRFDLFFEIFLLKVGEVEEGIATLDETGIRRKADAVDVA